VTINIKLIRIQIVKILKLLEWILWFVSSSITIVILSIYKINILIQVESNSDCLSKIHAQLCEWKNVMERINLNTIRLHGFYILHTYNIL
jgi:hypothetical protein